MITERLDTIPGFESIHRFENKSLKIVSFIARHSSALGTPLGGCRLSESYRNESEALADVLRLAEGMTLKAAIHNLPLGGGKMVVWSRKPLGEIDYRRVFEFVGRCVDSLGGSYITAEDMNTSVDDLRVVRGITPHAAGIESGDPSEFTALGVWETIRHLAENHLRKDVRSCRLAVQGVGKVGEYLLGYATGAGLNDIVICDLSRNRAKTMAIVFNCKAVGADQIYDQQCDFFVPCGGGGTLNSDTIPRLTCRVVAGAANNQFRSPENDEKLLLDRGISWCPDVVVNGGGLINVSCEFPVYDRARSERLVRAIPATLVEVLEFAANNTLTPAESVKVIARQRIGSGGNRQIVA